MTCRPWAMAMLLTTLLPAAADAAEGFATYRIAGVRDICGFANAINAHDSVVGASYCGDKGHRGFVWTPRRGVRLVSDLATGFEYAWLNDVNDQGTAVGYGTVEVNGDSYVKRAMLVPAKGRRAPLPHPGPPHEHSQAVTINNAGVVIGHVGYNGNYPLFNVRWHPDGAVEHLDLPPYSTVRAINSHGAIAYDSFASDAAFLQQPDGQLHQFAMGVVVGVNDRGVVAGWDSIPGNQGRPSGLVWSAERGPEWLPGPNNRPQAECTVSGINLHSQVVGECSDALSEMQAVIWQRIAGVWQIAALPNRVPNGALRDDRQSWSIGINDAGHILLHGTTKDGAGSMILVPDGSSNRP